MASKGSVEQSKVDKVKRRKHKPTGFEEWGGYMESKKMKLDAQFRENKTVVLEDIQETQIFKGVSIFVNGYTNPSANELKRLMLIHGGTFHHYYSTTKTTHVIASNLPKSKMKTLKSQIVVTAKWITESISAGKLLPHQNYLLYTPEMVDKQQRLNIDSFQRTKSETSLNNQQVAIDESMPTLSENTTISYDNDDFGNDTNPNSNDLFDSPHDSISNDVSNPNITVPQFDNLTSRNIPPSLKAGHPEFLTEFYNHSRLHHLSTAGQKLKRYVQDLSENNKERNFPERERLKCLAQENNSALNESSLSSAEFSSRNNVSNIIMHLDMDCFFVSVGLKKHPELKGHPVAVAHSKGKKGGPQPGSDIHYEAAHYANVSKEKIGAVASGKDMVSEKLDENQRKSKYSKDLGSLSEIACCSYEARRVGVKNGMLLGHALKLCPNLEVIGYDFEGYWEVSMQLYDIVTSYTLDIEAVSCDEVYIDCTELLRDVKLDPNQFASTLRSEIEKKTSCTASAGIGSNMLLARLANQCAKPNGQYYVPDSEIEQFMMKKKVKDLPGVGYKTSAKLKSLGVLTCSDLRNWSLAKLQQEFGSKTGHSLFSRCRGKDDRTVQHQKDRKSVSAEVNYGIRFEMEEDAYKFINELAVEVQNRVQNIGCKGKALTLKLMVRQSDAPVETAKFMGHGVCDHISKSVVLKSATDNSKMIGNECCLLARSLKIRPEDYRGVGIQLSKLESVSKDTRTSKIMESFLFHGDRNTCKNDSRDEPKDGVLPPTKDKPIEKSVQEKKTIKHFLSNKPSSMVKQSYKVRDYIPKEIDQSFLEGLPEDVKREVLETYNVTSLDPKTISVSSSDNPPSSSTAILSKQKQTSGTIFTLKSNDPPSKTIDLNEENSGPLKLDKSVPNALPDDLKEEVSQSHGHSSSAPKLKNPKSNQHKTSVLNFMRDCSSTTNSAVPKSETSNKPNVQLFNKKHSEKPKPSLGGAVEIEELRVLIREWILSTEEPLEEDVNALKNFLYDCADDDLFKAKLLVKYMYRKVEPASQKWKEAYLTALSHMQKKVVSVFGCKLDAETVFS